jgi:hypothetical protein
LGLPTARSAKKQLTVTAEDVLRSIVVIVDEMLRNVLSNRTAPEFEAAAREAFPRYVDLTLAFGRVVSATMPKETLARLSAESLCELEADIREHGVASFGAGMRDRASFTAFTLRKIAERLDIVAKSPRSPEADHQKDAEFAERFLVHALRSRFFIDCLVASMRSHTPLFPAVLPVVDDGLKSAVDAYAWIKQACDLRAPAETREIPDYLTAEDDDLVAESMADLAVEPEDGL